MYRDSTKARTGTIQRHVQGQYRGTYRDNTGQRTGTVQEYDRYKTTISTGVRFITGLGLISCMYYWIEVEGCFAAGPGVQEAQQGRDLTYLMHISAL